MVLRAEYSSRYPAIMTGLVCPCSLIRDHFGSDSQHMIEQLVERAIDHRLIAVP
jgi:hypothetical protein